MGWLNRLLGALPGSSPLQGVAVGDQILIGTLPFTIRGVIQDEPGRRVGDFSLGPRVLRTPYTTDENGNIILQTDRQNIVDDPLGVRPIISAARNSRSRWARVHASSGCVRRSTWMQARSGALPARLHKTPIA